MAPLVAATSEERAVRQAHLQQAEADFDPLPFAAAAARSVADIPGLVLVDVPHPGR